MTIENREMRKLYEMARERNGLDRADIAARIADHVESELRQEAHDSGIELPNDDRAENLVTLIFEYVLKGNEQ